MRLFFVLLFKSISLSNLNICKIKIPEKNLYKYKAYNLSFLSGLKYRHSDFKFKIKTDIRKKMFQIPG